MATDEREGERERDEHEIICVYFKLFELIEHELLCV